VRKAASIVKARWRDGDKPAANHKSTLKLAGDAFISLRGRRNRRQGNGNFAAYACAIPAKTGGARGPSGEKESLVSISVEELHAEMSKAPASDGQGRMAHRRTLGGAEKVESKYNTCAQGPNSIPDNPS